MQRSSPTISAVFGALWPVLGAFRHDLRLSVNMLQRIFRKSATNFGCLYPRSVRTYPVSFPEYPQSLNAISSVYPLLIQPSFTVLNRNLEQLSTDFDRKMQRLSRDFHRYLCGLCTNCLASFPGISTDMSRISSGFPGARWQGCNQSAPPAHCNLATVPILASMRIRR